MKTAEKQLCSFFISSIQTAHMNAEEALCLLKLDCAIFLCSMGFAGCYVSNKYVGSEFRLGYVVCSGSACCNKHSFFIYASPLYHTDNIMLLFDSQSAQPIAANMCIKMIGKYYLSKQCV